MVNGVQKYILYYTLKNMNPFFQICLKKCNSTTKIGNLTSLFFIYTGITPLEWKQTIKDKKPIIMPLFPLFQVIFG